MEGRQQNEDVRVDNDHESRPASSHHIKLQSASNGRQRELCSWGPGWSMFTPSQRHSSNAVFMLKITFFVFGTMRYISQPTKVPPEPKYHYDIFARLTIRAYIGDCSACGRQIPGIRRGKNDDVLVICW